MDHGGILAVIVKVNVKSEGIRSLMQGESVRLESSKVPRVLPIKGNAMSRKGRRLWSPSKWKQ